MLVRYRGASGLDQIPPSTRKRCMCAAPDRQITLRETRKRPIIPAFHLGLANILPGGHVAALSWTGGRGQYDRMSALIEPDAGAGPPRAQSLGDLLVAPALVVTLADDQGVGQVLASAVHCAARMPRIRRWAGCLLRRLPAGHGGDAIRRRRYRRSGPDASASVANNSVQAEYSPGWARRRRPLPAGPPALSDPFARGAFPTTVSSPARTVSSARLPAPCCCPLVGADLWYTDEPAALRCRADASRTPWRCWLMGRRAMNWPARPPDLRPGCAAKDRLAQDDPGPLTSDLTELFHLHRARLSQYRRCLGLVTSPVQPRWKPCTQIASGAGPRASGPVSNWLIWPAGAGDLRYARQLHPALGICASIALFEPAAIDLGRPRRWRRGYLGFGRNP